VHDVLPVTELTPTIQMHRVLVAGIVTAHHMEFRPAVTDDCTHWCAHKAMLAARLTTQTSVADPGSAGSSSVLPLPSASRELRLHCVTYCPGPMCVPAGLQARHSCFP
jgi:hypothetical protein